MRILDAPVRVNNSAKSFVDSPRFNMRALLEHGGNFMVDLLMTGEGIAVKLDVFGVQARFYLVKNPLGDVGLPIIDTGDKVGKGIEQCYRVDHLEVFDPGYPISEEVGASINVRLPLQVDRCESCAAPVGEVRPACLARRFHDDTALANASQVDSLVVQFLKSRVGMVPV